MKQLSQATKPVKFLVLVMTGKNIKTRARSTDFTPLMRKEQGRIFSDY